VVEGEGLVLETDVVLNEFQPALGKTGSDLGVEDIDLIVVGLQAAGVKELHLGGEVDAVEDWVHAGEDLLDQLLEHKLVQDEGVAQGLVFGHEQQLVPFVDAVLVGTQHVLDGLHGLERELVGDEHVGDYCPLHLLERLHHARQEYLALLVQLLEELHVHG